MSRNSNQNSKLIDSINMEDIRKGKTPLKPLREKPVNNESVISYPTAYDDGSELTQRKRNNFNKTMQGMGSPKMTPDRLAQINKAT